MQGGAVPFFLVFVGVLALLARFVDRWEFYRFKDKESLQFCKPSVVTGTQAFGRDPAYLDPGEVEPHQLVRFRVGRLGKDAQQMTARVVALEGQRVAIEKGEVKVDGKPFDDRFAQYRSESDWMAEVLVPAGCVFVLGDVRPAADRFDSRGLGPIPLGSVDLVFGPREVAK